MNTTKEHYHEMLARRASNVTRSTKLLADRNIRFDSKDEGRHLVVRHDFKVIDFWPAIGMWKDRESKLEARGVFGLLRFIGAIK